MSRAVAALLLTPRLGRRASHSRASPIGLGYRPHVHILHRPSPPPCPLSPPPLPSAPTVVSPRRLVARATPLRDPPAPPYDVVFLGTPDVAAASLSALLDAAAAPGSTFRVAAVVTQPARARGRGKAVQPTPVEDLALARGVDPAHVFTPPDARCPDLLASLSALGGGAGPAACVTVAYGCVLPPALLALPRCGTLNVHPSLLPRWRGAAPVPRCLQSRDPEWGVTVAFTVSAMDAGPVVARATRPRDPLAQACRRSWSVRESGG